MNFGAKRLLRPTLMQGYAARGSLAEDPVGSQEGILLWLSLELPAKMS